MLSSSQKKLQQSDFNRLKKDTDRTDAPCQALERVLLTGNAVMRGVVRGTIGQVKP